MNYWFGKGEFPDPVEKLKRLHQTNESKTTKCVVVVLSAEIHCGTKKKEHIQ